MKQRRTFGSLFLAGLLAASGAQPAAAAQDATAASDDDTALAEVVITGTRASLERSLNRKREAAIVEDSISATELGRFPDNNVAESLSHITGVAITRTAGGEGQRVSIRGLGPEFTLTTFNDRILGTDGAGRDFAFDVLPSDIISGADVIKSTQASITEGSIGGLINLRSASPFDNRGQHGLLRLEGDRNALTRLNGTKLSAAYSNTFGNGVGVLLGVVYANRKERTDTAGNDGGWTRNPVPNSLDWPWGNAWGGNIDLNNDGVLDPNEEGLIGPGQFRFGSIIEQKKRLALSGKVEWRASDDLKVVVDAIKTRLDSPQVGYQQSYYPLFAPGRWSNMTVTNGVVTDLTLDNPDPQLALNPELLNMTTHRVVDTALYGGNVEWNPRADLSFDGDVYQSTSSRHSGGLDTYVVLRMNQPNTTRIQLTGAQVPDITTLFNDGRELISGLANGQFGPGDFNTHYMSLSGDNVDDRINGFTLKGAWKAGGSFLQAVKFGASYTDRSKSRDLIDNSFNGGADYYSGDNAINVAALGGTVIDRSFTLPNFLSAINGQFPRTFLGFDVPAYLAALQAYNGHLRPDGSAYDFSQAAPAWDPLQSYRVTEKTTAAWVQFDLRGERWNGDVGVRLVSTATTSTAWEAKIGSITENGPFNYTVDYLPPSTLEQDDRYNFFLPSANFVWHYTDQLQLRLGAARTMARPSVDKLAPTSTTQSISWGDFTQVWGGNAKLKPYSANQADASLEWYYRHNSAANVAVFWKDIHDQITNLWLTGQDIGVPGHLFNVSRPINGDHARVLGYEIGVQHLWDNGFGVHAQYTHNNSRSWVGGEERPLEGIAPATSSLGLLYEKGKWSISTTADHTDAFVTAVGVLGLGFDEHKNATTWMSAQAAYAINDHLRVTLEGNNLLDAEDATMLGNGKVMLPNGYWRYGRSVTLGLSGTL